MTNKFLFIPFVAAFIATSLMSCSASTNDDFLHYNEDPYLVNGETFNEIKAHNDAYNSLNNIAYGETYSSISSDSTYKYLRFYTPLYANDDLLNCTVSYSRNVDELSDKNYSVFKLYRSAIGEGGTACYYNGYDIVTSDPGDNGWYFACYSIAFNSSSAFIDKDIKITLTIQSSKQTYTLPFLCCSYETINLNNYLTISHYDDSKNIIGKTKAKKLDINELYYELNNSDGGFSYTSDAQGSDAYLLSSCDVGDVETLKTKNCYTSEDLLNDKNVVLIDKITKKYVGYCSAKVISGLIHDNASFIKYLSATVNEEVTGYYIVSRDIDCLVTPNGKCSQLSEQKNVHDLTIDGKNHVITSLDNTNGLYYGVFDSCTLSNVVIENLTIESLLTGKEGLFGRYVQKITLTNCDFTLNTSSTGFLGGDAHMSTHDLKFNDCIFDFNNVDVALFNNGYTSYYPAFSNCRMIINASNSHNVINYAKSISSERVIGSNSSYNSYIKGVGWYTSRLLSGAEEHLVSGTLHDIDNYSFSYTSTLYSNTSSAYEIKYYADATDFNLSYKAGEHIRCQVRDATGVTLPISSYNKGETFNKSDHVIVVGPFDTFSSTAFTKTSNDLEDYGYQLYRQSDSNAVFICSDEPKTYVLGVNKFLELTLGYDCLIRNVVSFTKEDKTKIPTMNISEVPDYRSRMIDDVFSLYPNQVKWYPVDRDYYNPSVEGSYEHLTNFAYASGSVETLMPFLSLCRNYEGNGKYNYHNALNTLSPSVYYSSHSQWYSDDVDENFSEGDCSTGQLCFTAHGNAAQYQAMIDEMSNIVLDAIIFDANPANYDNNARNYDTVFIGIQDNTSQCTCDCCQYVIKRWGNTGAAYFEFLNKVADKVNTTLKEAYDNGDDTYFYKESVNLAGFAYNATCDAPSYKYTYVPSKYSSFVPDSSFKCNDNVGVYYAPIQANFNYSFYSDVNSSYATNTSNWNNYTNLLYYWMYDAHFCDYMYPVNSYFGMAETLRFLKSNSGYHCYFQAQHNALNRTHFSILKEYLKTKLMVNVNLDVSELIENFFTRAYGPASETMKDYFYELSDHLNYLHLNKIDSSASQIVSFELLGNTSYWDKDMLYRFASKCSEAIDIVDNSSLSSSFKLSAKNLIYTEYVFPSWALCDLYLESSTSLEQVSLRAMLSNALANTTQFSIWKESTYYPLYPYSCSNSISDKLAEWGIE